MANGGVNVRGPLFSRAVAVVAGPVASTSMTACYSQTRRDLRGQLVMALSWSRARMAAGPSPAAARSRW